MNKTQKHPFRRAVALTMAAALTAALPVGAFAEGENATTEAAITKQITKAETTYAPNTSFGFAVANGAAIPAQNVLAGVTGGAVMGNPVAFTPTAESIGQTTLSGQTQITFDASVFTAPGIYHYTVTENAGDYDGVTYDTTVKDLMVYVVNGTDTDFAVDGYVISNPDGTKSDVFSNDYGQQNDLVHDLTITNTVTGNQGDLTKPFTYTVIMAPAESGEKYLLVIDDDLNGSIEVGDTPVEFTLTHGQTAVLHGLSPNDQFTVVQDDYSDEGYTSSATLDGTPVTDLTVQGTITADATAAYVNDRSVTPPTGLVQEKAPYLAMLVGAAGLVTMLLFRRRNRE